jgi:SAM-dependent methyltransferase
MKRYDSICNICGGHSFQPFAQRSDGVPVIACEICGHGVVAQFTEDVQGLYGDVYFAAEKGSDVGYEDYAYNAEHGLAWAAALIRLLRPHGKVVDIGCANGRLLEMLGDGYDRFGIELNAMMAQTARRAGFSIIAGSLLDESVKSYSERFDVVSAIAVLEHIPDFRSAWEVALSLLRSDGLLLFEVPLIRSPDDIWFRSSLEHLHYPTERSLQYLFEKVLGRKFVGSTVEVEDYGCIYVGLTSNSESALQEAGTWFNRLANSLPASLSQEEARFRWFFDVIHAAKVTPELLRISPLRTEVSPLILRRVFELWAAREQRFESLEPYLRKVEDARDWHAAESRKRDEIIADQQRQIAEIQLDQPKLNDESTACENHTGDIRKELSHKEEQIKKLQADLDQRKQEGGRIGALQAQLDQMEESKRQLSSELSREGERMGGLQAQLTQQEKSLRELGEALNREERRALDLETALNLKEKQIQELENSWLWKIMKPLRVLIRKPRGSASD